EARLDSFEAAQTAGEAGAEAAGNSDTSPEPSPSAEVNGSGQGGAELELQAGIAGELVYGLVLYDAEGTTPLAETSLSVQVGPPPAVLLVATSEERGIGLEAVLSAQGLTVERTTPFRMPGSLERLRPDRKSVVEGKSGETGRADSVERAHGRG